MMKIAFSDYQGKILHAVDFPQQGFSRTNNGQVFNLIPIRWMPTYRCVVYEIGVFRNIDGVWQELFYRPFRENGNATVCPGDTVEIGVGDLILSIA